MTIEVNTNFVSKRLIKAGMTREEAMKNKSVFEAFNAANTIRVDDIIDEEEYKNYLKKTCSIELKTINVECIKNSAPYQYDETVLKTEQVDFYPGLEFGNIPKEAQKVYNLIDLKKNKDLSEEEIKAFNKARNMFEKTKNDLMQLRKKHGIKMGAGTFAGLAVAGGGAFFSADGIVVGGAFLGSIGPVGWVIAGVGVVGAGGYLLYEYYSYNKECKEIVQKLLEQTNNHPYILEHLKEL